MKREGSAKVRAHTAALPVSYTGRKGGEPDAHERARTPERESKVGGWLAGTTIQTWVGRESAGERCLPVMVPGEGAIFSKAGKKRARKRETLGELHVRHASTKREPGCDSPWPTFSENPIHPEGADLKENRLTV